MAIQDYYEFPTAYNPDTEQLQADAEFQVFAVTDAAQASPLPVFAADSGVAINPLRSNSIGMLPSFRVQGDPTQINIKSGSFVTRLTSKYGFVKEAGLDPETVAAAIAAVPTVNAAKVDAVAAASAALKSATDAAAVGATTDTQIESRIKDPASKTAVALRGTFVAFQKEDGTPLVAKHVVITVSNDGTSIADIKVVS